MPQYTIKTRITLRRDSDYEGHGFGYGIELLLLGIDKNGSLNATAKEMGMAYSKAWRILRQAEAEFEIQLIEREGAHGSRLTDEGRLFLQRYQEMCQAAEQAARAVYEKYYD
ncbi:MAG: LysR family transcriptional regulator [Bacillota bacterium]|nr:LysR family transcriptional regulator [Bacillota bacterium]